jgi:hypothetical protein
MRMQQSEGRAAIVTTLRNAGAVIDSFVAYHLAVGFGRIFLFFDDPRDPDLPRMAANPSITAIAHDAALRDAWSTLPLYAAQAPFIDTEVMARQSLNAALAMQMGRDCGFEWLLHIDADELFYSPDETVPAHFARLRSQPFETLAYLNYEAVPERDDIGDFFREADLFKLPPSRVPTGPAVAQLVSATPQLHPQYFHYYTNGKSAARLSVQGLQPFGVHRWKFLDRAAVIDHNPQHFILHYACCGFETFWTKYTALGRFADKWWQKNDIARAIGRFHLDARDVVSSGDREAARAFYRHRIAISDRSRIDSLIDAGVLKRLSRPRQMLEATCAGPEQRSAAE